MEEKQIVVNIIGAGISGLATALTLVKLDAKKFKINIIEARDVIGFCNLRVNHQIENWRKT